MAPADTHFPGGDVTMMFNQNVFPVVVVVNKSHASLTFFFFFTLLTVLEGSLDSTPVCVCVKTCTAATVCYASDTSHRKAVGSAINFQ